MKKYILFLMVQLSCLTLLLGQNHPSNDSLFNTDHVVRVDVSMSPADLDSLLDQGNWYSNTYREAQVRFTYFDGRSTVIDGAGIRLRGNTSRNAYKKSFKIKFSEFGGPNEYHDITKINMKGSHNDPCIMREFLAYEHAAALGLLAPRVGYVELYINQSLKGLYIQFEQIDKRFIDKRGLDKQGNLYKCSWGASLLPQVDVYDDQIYELKTNEATNDRSDLSNFVNVLNNTPDASFKTEIEKVLNVDQALKFLAVEVMLSHWDGYSYNKNNYYLYHNPTDDLFYPINYDLDNTLGIDWIGRSWASRDIYDWMNHGEARPLYSRLLNVPEYYTQYSLYIQQLSDQIMSLDVIEPHIDSLKAMIRPYVAVDPYYPLDYGFDSDDFDNAFDLPLGGHVSMGLKPYYNVRKINADLQLDQDALSIREGEVIHSISIHSSGNKIFVENEDWQTNDRIEVYDLLGHSVAILPALTGSYPLELTTGYYVVVINGKSGQLLWME